MNAIANVKTNIRSAICTEESRKLALESKIIELQSEMHQQVSAIQGKIAELEAQKNICDDNINAYNGMLGAIPSDAMETEIQETTAAIEQLALPSEKALSSTYRSLS